MRADLYLLYDTLYEKLVQLANIAGLDETELQKYFMPMNDDTPKGILKQLCTSLQNYYTMPSIIKFNKSDEAHAKIGEALYDFDLEKAAKEYQNWESIYKALTGVDSKEVFTNKDSWEKYAKGLYTGMKFLNSTHDFANNKTGVEIIQEFVNMDTPDEITDDIIKRMGHIHKNVHGIRLALTCDWLKECGCLWLAKPDTHTMKVYRCITNTEKEKVEIETIRYFLDWAKLLREKNDEKYNDITAHKIDRIIWLLSTRRFFMHDLNIDNYFVVNTIAAL